MFFITYINSLPESIDNGSSFLYADDTAIVTTGNDIDEICQNLDVALANASSWMNANKLSLNVDKTKVMYTGTSQRLQNVQPQPVTCNNSEIERVTKFKYMGLYIDQHLKF